MMNLSYNKSRHSASKGFTLIELLTVIAIIAVLAAILFPVFAQAKEAAKKTTCLSNQKQIAIATLLYAGDYDDSLGFEWFDEISPNVWVDRTPIYCVTANYNVSPTALTYSGGLYDAYLKAFQLTGCPSAQDLYLWDYGNYSTKSKGYVAIGRNLNNLDGANLSDVQEPANTVAYGDAAFYRTVLMGAPADGVYTNDYFLNLNSRSEIHARHNVKIATAWADGHAKIMPLTKRDAECKASDVALGETKAMLDAKNIGWMMPSGLVAQSSASSSRINWAVSIFNDPHFDNYFVKKKVP